MIIKIDNQNNSIYKTDKSKIKVTQYTEGNEQYLRVGPFKYEFPEKLSFQLHIP